MCCRGVVRVHRFMLNELRASGAIAGGARAAFVNGLVRHLARMTNSSAPRTNATMKRSSRHGSFRCMKREVSKSHCNNEKDRREDEQDRNEWVNHREGQRDEKRRNEAKQRDGAVDLIDGAQKAIEHVRRVVRDTSICAVRTRHSSRFLGEANHRAHHDGQYTAIAPHTNCGSSRDATALARRRSSTLL